VPKTKLEFDNKICDARIYGKFLYLLDEKLTLHRLTQNLKLDKSFHFIKDQTAGKNKLLLKKGSILYTTKDVVFTYAMKLKKTHSYSWLGEEILSVCESNDGKIIACGYKQGKIDIFYVYNGIYQSLAFDFGDCFYIDFDENYNRIIAIGSKNKLIVHDVELNITVANIRHDVEILKAKFLGEDKLFCLHLDGSTSIASIKENKIIVKTDNNLNAITSFALSPDKKFAIFGDNFGKLTAISIKFNKIFFTKEYESIVSNIKWIDETLFLFFENGNVEIHALKNTHIQIQDDRDQKNYQKAYKTLKKDCKYG